MRRSLLIETMASAFLVICVTGCEWEDVGSDEAWNQNYAWANFSGTYRPRSGMLVANFSSTPGGTTATEGTIQKYEVNNEDDGTLLGLQTKVSGKCDQIPLYPGSLTIRLWSDVYSAWIGTFKDDGGGTITGTYNIVGPDAVRTGTGVVEYDTGVWSVDLESPGLLNDAGIHIYYVFTVSTDAPVEDVDDEDEVTAGGNVYSCTVRHEGNRVHMTMSNGTVFEGLMGAVRTTAGETSGTATGRIIANFEASGVSGGENVTLVGTFEGDYTYVAAVETATVSTAASSSLMNRLLQGTWIEADGDRADIYGYGEPSAAAAAAAAP